MTRLFLAASWMAASAVFAEPAAKTEFHYTVYIGKPPKEVWNALTQKEFVQQYHLAPLVTLELKKGGKIAYGTKDSELISGVVKELSEPELEKCSQIKLKCFVPPPICRDFQTLTDVATFLLALSPVSTLSNSKSVKVSKSFPSSVIPSMVWVKLLKTRLPTILHSSHMISPSTPFADKSENGTKNASLALTYCPLFLPLLCLPDPLSLFMRLMEGKVRLISRASTSQYAFCDL